jgi:hypothetical protein
VTKLSTAQAKIRFIGHYGEPQIVLSLALEVEFEGEHEEVLDLEFSVQDKLWKPHKAILQQMS